jgi:heme/copper-type cytochrome/quinol oxidase subunit 3
MWWVVGSEIVIFGGLLASYLLYRTLYDTWSLASQHTNTVAGAINTFVLLTSSLFAVLAHHAAENGKGTRAAVFLWLTIGGALTFLLVKSIEWTHEIREGFTITSNTFWSFYYTAAGLHALHVIAGATAMFIVSLDCLKNKNLQRVELVGIYWHFVDIVWIFLFPLLYIAK